MPQGLQIWDAAGRLIVDHTSGFGSFLGSFHTNGEVLGTHSDSRLIGRKLIAFPTPSVGVVEGFFGAPLVTLNSATGVIRFTYPYVTNRPPYGGAAGRQHTIYYGAY